MKTILKLKTKRDHFVRSILGSGIILQNNPFQRQFRLMKI